MKISRRAAPWVAAAGALLPGLCMAADMDGSTLSVLWGVPFAGILLSIALMPLLAPIFWHHHFGKVAAAWGLAFLLPFAITFGPAVAGVSLVHALLAEYIPFVILLTALFTVAGGIFIRGNLHGSPGLNTAILAIGAVLASFMGTTGASMLLIRPLIRANDNRKHVAHVVGGGVLHFHRVQRRGLAHAAGRSAAVPRLPEGRGLFLDGEPHLPGNPVPHRCAVGYLLRAR